MSARQCPQANCSQSSLRLRPPTLLHYCPVLLLTSAASFATLSGSGWGREQVAGERPNRKQVNNQNKLHFLFSSKFKLNEQRFCGNSKPEVAFSSKSFTEKRYENFSSNGSFVHRSYPPKFLATAELHTFLRGPKVDLPTATTVRSPSGVRGAQGGG